MPVRFIRYNPDVYEPIKGQRRVKLEQREKILMEYVRYAMKHTPQEAGVFANVLYLFYDEHDVTWHELIRL
jgi:hemerythrin